jgi:RhtB (resistance to homoserine/threonine) family protein
MNIFFLLGSLFVIHILALISPGPNVFVVTQISMRYERYAGVLVALGLASGAAIWSIAALIGLNVIFEYVTWLYGTIRFVGGVYLIYLGIKLWRTADQEIIESLNNVKSVPTSWNFYRLGLLTTLTNPKAGIFFGGIFAAILPPALPMWIKFVAIAMIILDSAIFHIGLAVFFSTNRVKRKYKTIKIYVDRLAGAALTFLGIRLLFGNR